LLTVLFYDNISFSLVQESKLKYYGASNIDENNELILDSYLSSTTIDDEYVT